MTMQTLLISKRLYTPINWFTETDDNFYRRFMLTKALLRCILLEPSEVLKLDLSLYNFNNDNIFLYKSITNCSAIVRF